MEATLRHSSAVWLGAAHVGLVFLTVGAQPRTETGEAPASAWWCAPLHHAGQFFGWRLGSALAALRLAVLVSALARAVSNPDLAPGDVGVGIDVFDDDAGAAVDDLLKILAFYVGLLLLSPFWFVVGPPFLLIHLKG